MIEVELQNPYEYSDLPKESDFQLWVSAAVQEKQLQQSKACLSVVVRVVDEEEGLKLNHTYRNKNSTTNVLSFPYEAPELALLDEIPELAEALDAETHLGDLVLCKAVIEKEALEQNKSALQHWAHLIVHGTLHLQAYDHLNDKDAEEMETLEVNILKELGFDNPYLSK